MLKMRINIVGLSVPRGTLNLFLLTKNQNVMRKRVYVLFTKRGKFFAVFVSTKAVLNYFNIERSLLDEYLSIPIKQRRLIESKNGKPLFIVELYTV